MAKNTLISNEAVDVQADALGALCNNGYLRVFSGAQVATADTALGAQVMLAELRMAATAFAPAVDGLLTANAITADPAANASGDASFYIVYKSDGVSPVLSGTIGTADANMIVPTVAVSENQIFSCSALTHDVLNTNAGV